MSYCTAAEYRAKFPYCDLLDGQLAEWLDDASAMCDSIAVEAGVDAADYGETTADACKRVVRDMVHRAIGDGSSYMNGMQGSTQFFTSGESYSQTVNMGNGFADLYLRKQERADILSALREDGLTSYGDRRAACAAPSYGVFDAAV